MERCKENMGSLGSHLRKMDCSTEVNSNYQGQDFDDLKISENMIYEMTKNILKNDLKTHF
jgi:hypothetical protein